MIDTDEEIKNRIKSGEKPLMIYNTPFSIINSREGGGPYVIDYNYIAVSSKKVMVFSPEGEEIRLYPKLFLCIQYPDHEIDVNNISEDLDNAMLSYFKRAQKLPSNFSYFFKEIDGHEWREDVKNLFDSTIEKPDPHCFLWVTGNRKEELFFSCLDIQDTSEKEKKND